MSDRFAPGTSVRVKALHPPGHCRTPFYTRGRLGKVLHVVDHQPNPEDMAYGRPDRPLLPVYRVSFAAGELWPGESGGGGADDRVVVDIFEPWLEAAEQGEVR